VLHDDPPTPVEVIENQIMVSGVEHLVNLSETQVLGIMGLKCQPLPGIASHIPTDPNITHENVKRWNRSPKQLLSLRLYQLVGVVRMLELFYNGLPILLFDAPGLGKTLQICAFIAMISANRAHFDKYGHYLGQFRKSKPLLVTAVFNRSVGNSTIIIPNHPFLIVCEPSLVPMWVMQCRRFFTYGLMEILEWTPSTRDNIVNTLMVSSKSRDKIIITSFVSLSHLCLKFRIWLTPHSRAWPNPSSSCGRCQAKGRKNTCLALMFTALKILLQELFSLLRGAIALVSLMNATACVMRTMIGG
jgi:hypothetical protein